MLTIYNTHGSREAFLFCTTVNAKIKPIDEITRDKICTIINDVILDTEEGYLDFSIALIIAEILVVKAWKVIDILIDLDLYIPITQL